MCLVFLAFQVSDDIPVMLGANREESRSRPITSPVCSIKGGAHALLAGADQGPDGTFPEIGTWLGVNEAGLVVAVTNRSDGELAWADQIRSRGLLAVSLLGFEDPAEATEFACDALALGGYGGCNYLIADRCVAFAVHAPGARRITTQKLSPGLHCMTNLDLNDDHDARIRIVRASVEPGQFVDSAQSICRDSRLIVDGPERGTVSSTLILVGTEIQFYHVTGDPRCGVYEPIKPFLRGRSA
jgi:uncharacterized protein with NRDE domain